MTIEKAITKVGKVWRTWGIDVWIVITLAILGYFVYGQTLSGLFGVFLITLILSALTIFGLIPVLGVVIYYLFAKKFLLSKILMLTGLSYTWLVGAIFYICLCKAIINTLIMTYCIFIEKE